MLGLRSRWETEGFLRRAEAYHDYTMDDLERDIAAIRDAAHGMPAPMAKLQAGEQAAILPVPVLPNV